ncbi:MAG TPA: hypothetical protein DCE42_25565 [Myxococcales bacterium]|nr:hypothetical protein [Deltaproteobacteria bacterium]MBU53874.1 hypothetical protein [Deltaproteobacteria bacterium]HAA58157.1 hypothetical protein [Myxococcales bacterium]
MKTKAANRSSSTTAQPITKSTYHRDMLAQSPDRTQKTPTRRIHRLLCAFHTSKRVFVPTQLQPLHAQHPP